MLIELNREERRKKLLELGTSAENQKFTEYFDYYEGDHFVRSSLDRSSFVTYTRSGQPVFDGMKEGKFVICNNWCGRIIDIIADYTRGVNEDVVVTSDTAEYQLQYIWKDNQINTLTKEVANEAGKFGYTYLKLTQRAPGAPFELGYVDPGGCHEIINPITGVREGFIHYFGIKVEEARRLFPDIVFPGSGEVYYANEWTNQKIYKFIDGHPINEKNGAGQARDGNRYGFIPFYKIKADAGGKSDIKDVIGLNDEYNMILTFNHESLKYHGFPMYSPDGAFTQNNVLQVSQLKDVEIAPNKMMNFPFKRIESEGVSDSIINYMKELRTDISIQGRVPLKLLLAELDGSLSGVALQRLMASLISVAEDRRNYIKEAFKQINRDILSLLGAGEAETDIIFPDIIKIDTNERLDEAIKKQTLGISKQTIFEELGYEYEEEEEKRQNEFENSLEKRIMDEDQALTKKNDVNRIQPNSKQVPKK